MVAPSKDLSVAVVIIAYNQADCIAAAIESVLAQTARHRVTEIVVVDDASEDQTACIAQAYSDVNVIILKENSGGCATPRNAGIAATSAPLIAFLDGDDLWMENKIAADLEQFERHPNIGLLYSDYVAFDDTSHQARPIATRRFSVRDKGQLQTFFVAGGPIVPSSTMIPRRILDRVGLFDPSMQFNEDSELWNRIAAVAPLHHAGHALLLKREWFGSLGSAKYARQNMQAKEEISRRMLGAYPSLRAVARQRASRLAEKYAQILLATGDLDASKAELRRAMALDPLNWRAILRYVAAFSPIGPPVLSGLKRLQAHMVRSAR